eukprot:scaffold94_cov254-Pinguiococcus_pyrenoidosus.AAC.12
MRTTTFFFVLLLIRLQEAGGAITVVENGIGRSGTGKKKNVPAVGPAESATDRAAVLIRVSLPGRRFTCIPAAFGPKAGRGGVLGRLQIPKRRNAEQQNGSLPRATAAALETGCVPFGLTLPTTDGLPVIVLIRRSAPNDEVTPCKP